MPYLQKANKAYIIISANFFVTANKRLFPEFSSYN
jgi:hypothetical protein